MSRSGPSKPEATLGEVVYSGLFFPYIFFESGGVFDQTDFMDMMHANAAWHFCRSAHEALQLIPAQATKEGDVDITANLRTIADSICQIYGVEIEEMMKRIALCRLQAFKLSRPWDMRLQAWVDSGGRAYNLVDRDPDKI